MSKLTNHECHALIHERKPFVNAQGSLSGRIEYPGGVMSIGKLPDEWRAELLKAFSQGEHVYVVFSYATPIAWAISTNGVYGEWIKPPVKYSSTTSNHWGMVY